jgi:hypothetical protein
MSYSRGDVETHRIGYGDRRLPAVNVKARSFPSLSDVVVRFKCSVEVADRALRWAFEMAQEVFWEDVKELVSEHFPGAECWSEGRQGGWLVVEGLGSIDEWDAIALGAWRRFEKDVKGMVADACNTEQRLTDIEANRWAEENAERYNFFDRDGETICLADVERCLHCSGKGGQNGA